MNQDKLNQFIGQMLSDLGGASSIAMVRMGDALGLYKALHSGGAVTSQDLADKAKVDERYLREWLSHQAASGYLAYEPATRKFSLPPEQAMVFAVEDSPVYMMGGFDLMAALLDNQPKVQAAFKSGGGVAWGEQAGCMFCAVARFFRPGYHNNLVSAWLPALDGVADKLRAGARVADVGCGHGWSTVLMAKAFPKSQFVGYDFHPGSIEEARRHAEQHGTSANARFEVALAKDYPGRDFDLVTCFDCLHDMGDPEGAAAHVRQSSEARRQLDDRRANGGRCARAEHQSGRAAVLCGLDHDLPADVTRAGSRRQSRRSGRRGEAARGDHARWLPQNPAGDRDAVQHDSRGAAVSDGPSDGPE